MMGAAQTQVYSFDVLYWHITRRGGRTRSLYHCNSCGVQGSGMVAQPNSTDAAGQFQKQWCFVQGQE